MGLLEGCIQFGIIVSLLVVAGYLFFATIDGHGTRKVLIFLCLLLVVTWGGIAILGCSVALMRLLCAM